jgi:hypothetical protein
MSEATAREATDEAITDDAPEAGGEERIAPPTAVESLVNAFLESGPDVAEHLVRAAQELLLAAQVAVDAAQSAVKEQQELRASAGDDDAPAEGASVHHLDRSE